MHTQYTTAPERARAYNANGIRVTRLRPGTKQPVNAGWQEGTGDDPDSFQDGENIGGLMGTPSGGRTDVDCDDATFALAAARTIPTGDVYGRASKPDSHRIVLVKTDGEPLRRIVHADPIDGTLLGELRGDGHQTMLPGSTHPSGEPVEWSTFDGPKSYTREQIELQAGIAATIATIVRNWHRYPGQHHEIIGALAGGMLRDEQYPVEKVEQIVRGISHLAGDHEPDDRVRRVRDTDTKRRAGEPTTGFAKLGEIIGTKAAQTIRGWLGVSTTTTADEWTDAGNADRLIERHGENLRYCPGIGWLYWDGKQRWKRDETGQVVEYAKAAARSRFDDVAALDKAGRADDAKRLRAFTLSSLSMPKLLASISAARSDPRVVVAEPDEFDANPMLFNVENGTINLRTGGITPHDRGDLITQLAPVVFDPRATAPRFTRFLADVLPDPAVRGFVQRHNGYTLTGQDTEKVVVILHGPTDTGKTTYVETVQALFGPDYSKVVAETTISEKRGNNIPNDIARLRGARQATVSEMADGARLDAARIKAMSGRTRLVGRFMRAEFFEFQPTFKLLIDTNFAPKMDDADDAVWSRVKLVPFEQKVEKPVKGMREMLRAELSGVLNWSIAGCLDWQARGGLDEPESVKAATREYRDSLDPLVGFFDERCVFAHGETVTQAHLYNSYASWATENGIRYPMKGDEFRRRVLDRDGVTNAKGAKNKAIYRGVSATDGPAPLARMGQQVNPFQTTERAAD